MNYDSKLMVLSDEIDMTKAFYIKGDKVESLCMINDNKMLIKTLRTNTLLVVHD